VTADVLFDGHQPRECGEHRTVGSHRAWCFDCTEWCYPGEGCKGCRLGADSLAVIEGAENVLPELDRMRENLGGEPMIPAARWQLLKDYLSGCITADEAVRQGMVADGETEKAAPFGGLVSANRSTLAKMRELEG
jgi:hypothetical protein